jgi:polyisoprenoid-binding protein YceI
MKPAAAAEVHLLAAATLYKHMHTRRWIVLFIFLVLTSISADAADRVCVVPENSQFRINVGTGGLFGAFAHDHLIEATKIEGCAAIDLQDLAHSSIALAFPTSAIRVLDPKQPKDIPEVQKTMETEVLAISQYPEIKFESTRVERAGTQQQLRVSGKLTIRGKSLPVVIPLTLIRQAEGTYRATGRFQFKQSAFGIKPVKVAGGTVKVKDELETEFDIVLK